MKLSASVYSNKSKDLDSLIKELDAYSLDFFHIDCMDNLNVFEDIKKIRAHSNIPIDLHIITSNPDKFYKPIAENNIEYVTFQYENLKSKIVIPSYIKSKLGIAIVSETDINVFEDYKDFSHILFMTTTPGESGGKFNKDNFKKIRKFRAKYTDKKIHVDGGINNELSFILRNMGVYAAVTGSYLMNQTYMGSALLKMKSDKVESQYRVKDFMLEGDEIPVIKEGGFDFLQILQSIEDCKMGFTMIAGDNDKLNGIISNAEVRKALIKNINDLNNIDISGMINRNPAYVNENSTVSEVLQYIKNLSFPVLYLPVVDDNKRITGTLKFNNLIKGES